MARGFVVRISMQLCGAIILLWLRFFRNMYGVVAGFGYCVLANAGIMPNTNACYLQSFKQNSGKAAGYLGSMQFLIASIVSGLVAYFLLGNLWPVGAVVLASAITTWNCNGKN